MSQDLYIGLSALIFGHPDIRLFSFFFFNTNSSTIQNVEGKHIPDLLV